jgi:hypothetical protein
MWALLSRNNQVAIIAALSIILAWGIEYISERINGHPSSTLKYISFVTMAISSVITLIVGVIWRRVWLWFPFIGKITFPDLNGTWEGHLLSTWTDPKTGQPKPKIPTKIWVRQSIFTTTIKLQTGESTSYSTRCLLEADRDAGRFRFWYSYSNQPKAKFSSRSARHDGVAWLELDIDTDHNRLIGYYYTDRKTSGDIDVIRINRTIR